MMNVGRRTLAAGVMLAPLFAMSFIAPPPQSGASQPSTKANQPSLGSCTSGISTKYAIPPGLIPGLEKRALTESRGKPVSEPIATEPVMNEVQVNSVPSAAITESLHDPKLPLYDDAIGRATVREHPTSINEAIETIAWFKSAKRENSYERQLSRVSSSQFSVGGSRTIKVKYLGSSDQVSLPNSVYSVSTTMPNAPTLLFYVVRFGTFVTTFAFYGGSSLAATTTSIYVNLGEQQVVWACTGINS
jgi:hypothetical protein